MKKKQINYTLEQVKENIVRYDELAMEAYSVRDGNLYMLYKDLRDDFMERYQTMLTEKQKCSTKNSTK